MNKKINIGSRPSKKAAEVTADAWVETRDPEVKEKMKRLTIDVPESLHREIKATTAMKGVKMNEDIRELLEREYRKV